MYDELNQAKVVLNRLFQACDNHYNLYPKVEEASEAEWEIWLKIGQTPPKDWSPRVITEWRGKGVQLKAQLNTAHTAWQDICQTINNYESQLEAKTLGEGQFGHSGKPGPKPAKPSIIDLSEAYILANRAIHNHRAKFFNLNPQEKKIKLITVAKTLAKLQFDKNRAHHKLAKASRQKFSHKTKILLKWETPAGGIHVLLKQKCKISHWCPPL